MRRAIVIGALVIVTAAACGSGSDETYGLDASESCLEDLGQTSDSLDFIAENASAGATRLVINGKEVMVMFGADSDEAESLAEQYEGVPGEGAVKRSGNAVMAWTDEPSGDEASSVSDCLR